MLGSTTGAHAASSPADHSFRPSGRPILGLALAAAVIATLAIAPAVQAATRPVGTTSQTATLLSTTTIDRPWYSTEQFYLGLLNCTRTGGWVLSNGTCRGYGSGYYSSWVAPITYSFGLSDNVSRPYSAYLAVRAACSHTADGDPGYRLRRAGYTRWTWGENIGCRDGYSTAKAAVLASHLVFQSEKSSNGGHWVNMKNRSYHWVGVGIWRSGSRTRLVIDFYG